MKCEDGQIFIDKTGGGSDGNGNNFLSFSMFEYDSSLKNGAGRIYNQDGSKTYYFWAHPSEPGLCENLPEDILYSFRHGTWHFSINEKIAGKCDNNIDIIEYSDFKYISISDVDEAKILSGISTIEEVKKHWKLIKTKPTIKIIMMCFDHIGAKINPCQNGEIGIWSLMVSGAFHENINIIEAKLFDAEHLSIEV